MASFQRCYRSLFQTFGCPLSEHAKLSTDVIAAAQKRLGVPIPAALRDYYLVAGRERRFATCYQRILPPSQWTVDKHRLIFMEENQCVVFWGVSVRNPKTKDPPVSQGINDDPIAWYPEHRKCSVFLAVMLHYQAVNGGLRFCGQANAPDTSSYRFEEHGWTRYGVVNSLIAYSRPNQVVCLMPPDNLPFLTKWSILAGGKTRADLRQISDELEVKIS